MNKKVLILFALLISLYLIINFATPTNPMVLARFNMDATQYQLVRAGLAVPLIIVWFAAFYGFSRLMNYAKSIQKSPDGIGFMWVASGLAVLGVGMLVNSILATAFSRAVAMDILSQPISTIIGTHLSVGHQLLSFILVAIGSWKLLKTLEDREYPKTSLAIGGSLLALISILYIVATLNNPSREVPVPPAQTATYYMNDLLIFTTIIIPYILVWICGIFAFIAIRTYQKHIGGILYKKALKKLNIGLLVIISMSIVLQFVTAAITAIYAWQLGALVLITYLLVFIIGIGFVFVALGAKELAKLEEVS